MMSNKNILPSPGRTQGDGMENETAPSTEINIPKPGKIPKQGKTPLVNQFLYKPDNLNQITLPPPVITGKIINLVPKNATCNRKNSVLENLKTKEPKFVPFEPYKAAVNPIIPYSKKGKTKDSKPIRKISSEVLPFTKLSDKTEEINNTTKEHYHVNENNLEKQHEDRWDEERKMLEGELKTLRDENGQLESQLKFQTQVNAELKTLLVAAVGEDIETRVHLLTEDKLQLAKALLNSAQRLSTHQEQTDWLAGQCEVWRSKFLASSLMVEELAKWKAALCQRVTELQESTKRILEEHIKMRDSLSTSYKKLSMLRDNFDHPGSRRIELPTSNLLDLSSGIHKLSEVLELQFLGSLLHHKKNVEVDFTGLDSRTQAEKTAEFLLMNQNPILLSGRPDAACNAVMGAAVAIGGSIIHGNNPLMPPCCSHCSGEVKLV